MSALEGVSSRRRCPYCGKPRAIVVRRVSESGAARRVLIACPMCLGAVIDQALGWRIRLNIAQGLAARSLAQQIQRAKPKGVKRSA